MTKRFFKQKTKFMNTKTMISGVLGGVTYFLLGFLIWEFLLKDMMSDCIGSATGIMRAENEMIMWAMIIGNLGYGFAFAYALGTWSGVTTFIGGAKAAAAVAFLFTLGYDMIYYATTNMSSLTGVIYDLGISTFIGAMAGGVIGWWLGRP